jgi:TorA maturation chaperone TorD
MDSEFLDTMLGARAFAYHAMHAIFGVEPTEEARGVLSGETMGDLAQVFADGGLPRAAESFRVLQEAAKHACDPEELGDAYMHLLVGPGALPSSPWESTYLSNERVLFQESTLDVRRAYAAQGLIPQGYPHVADDHIAIECDFLGKLGDRMAEALADGDAASLRAATLASKDFLEAHLGTWAGDFARGVSAAAESSGDPAEAFYARSAETLASLVEEDKALLSRIADA